MGAREVGRVGRILHSPFQGHEESFLRAGVLKRGKTSLHFAWRISHALSESLFTEFLLNYKP